MAVRGKYAVRSLFAEAIAHWFGQYGAGLPVNWPRCIPGS
jgi:hypothetical protein